MMQDKTYLRFNTVRAPEVEPEVVSQPVPIALDYIFLGRAGFAVTNPEGKTYQYRVKAVMGDDGDLVYFLNVRNSKNHHRFDYVGKLTFPTGALKVTGKSKFTKGTPEYEVAAWALDCIREGMLPSGYTITHLNECGVCRIPLKLPEEQASGICDECFQSRAKFQPTVDEPVFERWNPEHGEWVGDEQTIRELEELEKSE